jgi:hypothetical protein
MSKLSNLIFSNSIKCIDSELQRNSFQSLKLLRIGKNQNIVFNFLRDLIYLIVGSS